MASASMESGQERELEIKLSSCSVGPAMDPAQNTIEIYQLRAVLRETSPHIRGRVLVRSDSSIMDLHQTIQIALE